MIRTTVHMNSTNCTNDCDSCSKKYWKYIKYNSSDYQIAYEGDDTSTPTSDSLGLKWIENGTKHWELHKGNEQNNSTYQNCMLKIFASGEFLLIYNFHE